VGKIKQPENKKPGRSKRAVPASYVKAADGLALSECLPPLSDYRPLMMSRLQVAPDPVALIKDVEKDISIAQKWRIR
jgi:hypothetical protein